MKITKVSAADEANADDYRLQSLTITYLETADLQGGAMRGGR